MEINVRGIKTSKRVALLGIVTVVAILSFYGKDKLFAAPIPLVSFQDTQSSPFVGEDFSFTVRFDNTGNSVGYGPYVDVIVPEHVTINSMTHLGTSLSYESGGVFPAGDPSCVTHPFARDNTGALETVCLSPNPGTNVRLYAVKLPFGSFVDTQTVADIVVSAHMDSAASIGVAETIRSQGGFYLGTDALDNPTTDPSFTGGLTTTNVTPSVIRLTKQYVADYLKGASEHEIAPGPNNSQLFRITADVANGATVTNLVLSDVINNNLLVTGIESTSPTPTSTSLVGNSVSATWASVTGGSGSSDAVLTIRFEAPYRNIQTSTKILDETAGGYVSVANTATANGVYNSIALSPSTASLDNNLEIKPLVAQKTVSMYSDTNASGYSPGDTVQYTIDTYVGDYQVVTSMGLTDTLPDGLTYVPGSSQVSIIANGSTYTSSVTPTTSAGPGPGEVYIDWDLSSEGTIRGGCVQSGGTGVGIDPNCSTHNDGRTRIRTTFRATINDSYSDGDRVEHKDTISNSIYSNATKLTPTTLASTAVSANDSSSASLTIVSGNFTKTIYAVNGSTTLPPRLQPGDEVTYRLQYAVPSTDFSSIRMDDYLPLPMFSSAELTTFNATDPLGTIPAAGEANFGTNETLYSYLLTAPTLSTQAGNVARFEWAATHDPSNISRTIDILFTVTINDAAYAPGLYITNQATVTENNIQTSFASNSVQQIELEIPELSITKGAVNSDNTNDLYSPIPSFPFGISAPGTAGVRFSGTVSSATLASTPVHSDVSGLDAGDVVTFAVAVENSGKGDSYETRIKDTMPAGFTVPGGGINLNVSNGTGSSVAYTNVGGGSGLFDQGIELTPAINDGLSASGTNIIIITYDLQIASTAELNQTYTNNAQITKFTAKPAGVNYMNNQASYQDSADVTLASPTLTKVVTSTNNADTSGNNVAVGEEITYTLTTTVPEGKLTGATLVDTMDACLAVTGFDSLTASSNVTATNGSFATVLGAVSVANVGGGASNNGRQFTLDFGDIANTNSSNGVDETITLVYRAVAVNSSACARGNSRTNSATLTWDTTSTASVTSSPVIIQEPAVTTTKTFTVAGGDADDVKTVQLVISATSGSNYSPAYNVVTTDTLTGSGFDYVGNISYVSGVSPTSSGEIGGVVTFNYDQLNPGQTSTVRFDVRVKQTVQANSTQPNTATSKFTSMLGTPSGLTTYNALGCERTGNTADCGTTENDYTTTSTANLTITNVSNTKTQVSTSEAHTSGSGVAIGEIVRYRLVSRIPEGTQTNYVLRDAIPNGMSYMNDGTTKASFVYSSSFTSSTLTDPSLNSIGDETTVSGVVPTYVLTGGAISAGANVNGTDVDFNFGTITNTDNDANFEYIVVEFNALIRNESSNTRGTILNNNFSTRINGAAITGTTSANSGVTVQEPQVAISKVVTTAPVDAGDPVVYTITITNTSGTNVESGYEWAFTDTLNTHLQFDSISNISLPGYATLDSSATAGQNVSAIISRIDPGDSVSFRINATVKNTAPANFIVPNTGSVTTTSLPGANGTTSNATGSSTPGATNATTGEESYSSNSSVNTTLGTPSIDKQAPLAGTDYTIGQTVVYPILVTVPEGVVQNVTIVDQLPAGLRYESYSLDLTGFSGTFVNDPPLLVSPATVPGANGEDLVLDFGNISTPGTLLTNDSFIVNVTARVLDVAGNYDGQVLANSATLAYTNPNTSFTTNINDGPVNITIREPRLSLSKALASGDPRVVGDTLSYAVDVTSDGSIAASEWSIDDTLPSHTSLLTAPVCTNVSVPVAISQSVSSGVLHIAPNPLAGSTLPVGETVHCSYELEILSTAVAGSTYTNTADADWRSMFASTGYGRSYADAVATLNDGSQDTDTATFTMDEIGITKTDNGRTTAVVGDTINYTLTIGAPNATLADFTVTDTLPEGLIYTGASVITGTGSVTPTVTGDNDGNSATTVEWDFGTIAHDGTQIVITYTAKVANVSGAQNATVITNGAEVSFTPELSTPVTATSSDSFTIKEPVVTSTIVNNNATPRFGETVLFTIDVAHAVASTATAYELSVTAVIPSEMTYVAGSAVLPSGWSVSQSGQSLIFTKSSFAIGETPSITYEAQLSVTPSLAILGDILSTQLNTIWSSMSGTVTGERLGTGGINDYATSDSTDVSVSGVDVRVSKDDQVAAANPTDTIVYKISYSNYGNETVSDTTITEVVPENTVFDATNSTAGWSCADGSLAGTTCTFAGGAVMPLEVLQIDFAVQADDTETLPRDVTELENIVTISSPDGDGIDADLTNNSYTEHTPLRVSDVSIVKNDTVDPVYLDHDYSYELVITNNGPDNATNIVVSDPLPEGVLYRAYSSDTATCVYADPMVTCTVTSLANGATETILIDVTGDTPGDKLNTASLVHDQQDPNLDNNQDSEHTLVDPADIVLTKTADKTNATVGDIVTFTITVKNNGPDTATNVVITDTLPSLFDLQSTSLSQGFCSGSRTITCPLGTLLNGQTVVITMRTKVLSAGKATNSVSSTLNEYDPDTTNSTAIGVEVTTNNKVVSSLVSTGRSIALSLIVGCSLGGIVIILSKRKKEDK